MLQNTTEWYAWRREGIGASDAPIIMKVSKYMTPYQLYLEKIGQVEHKKDDDFIKRQGHKYEAIGRAVYELESGNEFAPKIVEHSQFAFLRASLDGFYQDEQEAIVFENKFVGKDKFQLVKKGECPPEFYPQIQHQLMVTGANYAVLNVIDERKETANMQLFPDLIYIEELLKYEINFWDCVLKKVPPEQTDKDIQKVEDQEAIELIKKYKKIYNRYKPLEKELENIKHQIYLRCHHPQMVYKDIKLIKGNQKGRVDYKHILDIHAPGVNVDDFRGPDCEFFRITINKK